MTNLEIITARLEAACRASGRRCDEVCLLAVSKTFGPERIRALATQGQRRFGENYLQEALGKQAALSDLDLEWHFIGPLQSNKAASVAAHFDWVHSVDRIKLVRRLSAARQQEVPLQVCVQVNISGEASKSGCVPEDAAALCAEVQALPGLQLRGLMAIPAPPGPNQDPRIAYRQLRVLYDSLLEQGMSLDTLSAGMSADLEAAVAEGATMVRIGSALFGPRQRH